MTVITHQVMVIMGAVHFNLMKQDVSGFLYNLTPLTIIILTLLRRSCQHCLLQQLTYFSITSLLMCFSYCCLYQHLMFI